MKRQINLGRQSWLLITAATTIVLCASGSIFAQSKVEGNPFAAHRLFQLTANQSLWPRSAPEEFGFVNSQLNALLTANFAPIVSQPKPDFSAMEKWYEIIRYEYSDPYDRRLNIYFKPKVQSRPYYFNVEYRDKDGVLVGNAMGIDYIALSYADPDKVAKAAAWTPSELEMERVVSATVVRIKN